MSNPRMDAPTSGHAGQVRFDARCQLCSRLAGQLVDGTFVHHPDCLRTIAYDRSAPRCCDCGGRLYFEPSNGPISTAAEREAARHYRPSRS